MVAEAEVLYQLNMGVLDVKHFPNRGSDVHEVVDADANSPPSFDRVRLTDSVSAELLTSQEDVRSAERISSAALESAILQFILCIRSGSFADIGPLKYMEDEHIRIDDLSSRLGSLYYFPKPSAFYRVFDGHGGPEAAAYIRNNVIKFFFEDVNFP